MMDLDRGNLERLDRKLLAGLGHDETYRMVRVPVTASKWSAWKRYCDPAGTSMGPAIVTLIDGELVSVFGDHTGERSPVFGADVEQELARRLEQVALREEKARGIEERLRRWSQQMREREGQLEARALACGSRESPRAGGLGRRWRGRLGRTRNRGRRRPIR